MNEMVKKLFPEGQRKLVVSLIALAIAIAFEKFTKQGLTPEMKDSLIAIVAIFTGGNVMEHFANAVKVFKGTKAGEIIEAILPGDQGLGKAPEAPQAEEYLESAPDLTNEVQDLYQRIGALQQAQQVQSQNMAGLIDIVNKRTGNGPTK